MARRFRVLCSLALASANSSDLAIKRLALPQQMRFFIFKNKNADQAFLWRDPYGS